jgi:hypothetical protein
MWRRVDLVWTDIPEDGIHQYKYCNTAMVAERGGLSTRYQASDMLLSQFQSSPIPAAYPRDIRRCFVHIWPSPSPTS